MQDERSRNCSSGARFLMAVCLMAVAVSAMARDSEAGTDTTDGALGLNLFGPLVGIYSGSLEFTLHEDWSLFVVPVYFNAKGSLRGALFAFTGVAEDDYELWALSGAIGANYFLTDRAPVGLFAGGSFEPGYLYANFKGSATTDESDDEVTVDTPQIGAGVHVGYRALWGPVAITPRASLSYHYLFDEAERLTKKLERAASIAYTRFSFGLGLDLGIAF